MTSQRQLGLWTAAALVVANMIGTGVFTTSGFLLADLGSPWIVIAAWAMGGLIAALGALSYGALARRIPESGGEYLFLSRTLHPAAGYVAGWISLLVGFSAPLAAVAYGFGEYVSSWLPGWNPKWTGTLLLAIFAVVHARDVRGGAWVQNAAVLVKLAAIAIFIGFAGTMLDFKAHSETPAPFDLGAFAVSLVWISFSYAGWNAAVYIGGEVRDPERTLPRALLIGTAIVAIVYVALNAVFVFSAPTDVLKGELKIGRIAAEALGGPALAEIVTALVALALITSVSSMMMIGPRVYAKMASDGYMPKWLAATDGPPRASIAFQLCFALLLLWTATYESLLTYIGFTLGVSTAATVLGLIFLRLREGARFAVPGWPWVPALFVAFVVATTGFSMGRRPLESGIGVATIAVGLVAWALTGRSRRNT